MQIHHLSENNSVLNHFLEQIRNEKVQGDRMRFRRNIERIGEVMAYEMSKKLQYEPVEIQTPLGIKKSSAQITHHYSKEALLNKQIVAVVNFPPKQIATFFSECLVLGVYDEHNNVVLLQPNTKVGNGQKIG